MSTTVIYDVCEKTPEECGCEPNHDAISFGDLTGKVVKTADQPNCYNDNPGDHGLRDYINMRKKDPFSRKPTTAENIKGQRPRLLVDKNIIGDEEIWKTHKEIIQQLESCVNTHNEDFDFYEHYSSDQSSYEKFSDHIEKIIEKIAEEIEMNEDEDNMEEANIEVKKHLLGLLDELWEYEGADKEMTYIFLDDIVGENWTDPDDGVPPFKESAVRQFLVTRDFFIDPTEEEKREGYIDFEVHLGCVDLEGFKHFLRRL
jgi:hypothetical protein